MKYKLLSVRGREETNIGDYIQALAAAQFLPSIDGFIDREKLKEYHGEKCKVIMNGWYMHNPMQWPPSLNIIPLFVAFHLNSLVQKELLSEESVSYLKQYTPIGCRDFYTQDNLNSKGIESYFSACMTLTLGYKYKSTTKENKCYFVDPAFTYRKDFISLFSNFFYLIKKWNNISIISAKIPTYGTGFKKKMRLVDFYREYSKIFTEETLLEAEYVCQQSSYYKNIKDDKDRLKEAENLIKKYAKASLVVTSRIHCALPCLGLETPVLFTEESHQEEASMCRFGGLRELFTIIRWEEGKLIPEFKFKTKISKELHPSNKDNWKLYAEMLKKKCIKFVQET